MVGSSRDCLVYDFKYDWLVTREAFTSGGNAYETIDELAREYGVRIGVAVEGREGPAAAHPRLPGALLLQAPIAVIRFDLLVPVMLSVSGLFVLALTGMVTKDWGVRDRLLAMGAVFLTYPVLEGLLFGSQSAMVALMAVGGWRLLRERDSALGGALIGIATTLKLFPAALVVPLLVNRRFRGVGTALGVFVGLNLLGLGLPGVDAGKALEALFGAADRWSTLPSNGSLWGWLNRGAGPLAVTVGLGVVAALLAASRRSGVDRLPYPVWTAASLLFLPLAWSHYDLALLPCAVDGVSSGRRLQQAVSIGLGVLWVLPILGWVLGVEGLESGAVSTVVRAVLVAAFAVWPEIFPEWQLESATPEGLA